MTAPQDHNTNENRPLVSLFLICQSCHFRWQYFNQNLRMSWRDSLSVEFFIQCRLNFFSWTITKKVQLHQRLSVWDALLLTRFFPSHHLHHWNQFLLLRFERGPRSQRWTSFQYNFAICQLNNYHFILTFTVSVSQLTNQYSSRGLTCKVIQTVRTTIALLPHANVLFFSGISYKETRG